MWTTLSPEDVVPVDHPLRSIGKTVNEIFAKLSPEVSKLYSKGDRSSIAPENPIRPRLDSAPREPVICQRRARSTIASSSAEAGKGTLTYIVKRTRSGSFIIALLTVVVLLNSRAAGSPRAGSPACSKVQGVYHGTLCLPTGRGLHPAIVIAGGSNGGDTESSLASEFAEQGYVASSVEYFAGDGLPLAIASTPIEPIGDAVKVIRKRADVDKRNVSLLGISRGGELALLVASHYPSVTSVISMVGSPFAWGGNEDGSIAGWSFEGKDVPYLSTQNVYSKGLLPREALYRAIRDKRAVAAAFIHLEKINGPMLFVSAGHDEVWDSVTMARYAKQYLRLHPSRYPAQYLEYPLAGHLFFYASRADPSGKANMEDIKSADLTTRYTAAATDAWAKIFRFLRSKAPA